MNKPIRNLAVGCMVLFLALLINVTYLQYWQADSLNDLAKHGDNKRVRDAEYSRDRGAILVAGKAIAESNKSKDQYKYQRYYPQPREYADITGFFSRDYGLGGVESTANGFLSGSASSLFVNRVIDLFDNQSTKGGSVSLTIDPAAQKAAYDGLKALGKNTRAAAVAIQPSTGKILAMVSTPTYDPNKLASHDFNQVGKIKAQLENANPSPLDNRAIETVLPPGSTFKLVTAAAALSTGRYTPSTIVQGGSSLKLPQTSAHFGNEDGSNCGGNKITLTHALQVSCNVSFGSIGLKIGGARIRAAAEKFGFNAPRQYFTDLDDDLTSQAISRFPTTLTPPQQAQAAIGQFDVAATPLEMAMVASGIANNGTVMSPYLIDEVRTPDLDVVKKATPQPIPNQPAISSKVARDLTEMMVAVVDGGTGTTAAIPGVKVAGKTGTANSAPSRPPYAWFVSFAPADTPKVAVAVLVQDAGVARDQISGSGLAAPIAKAIMQAVINR